MSGMGTPTIRPALVAIASVTLAIASAGAAYAVSSGGYDPAQQDCSPTADANNRASMRKRDGSSPNDGASGASE